MLTGRVTYRTLISVQNAKTANMFCFIENCLRKVLSKSVDFNGNLLIWISTLKREINVGFSIEAFSCELCITHVDTTLTSFVPTLTTSDLFLVAIFCVIIFHLQLKKREIKAMNAEESSRAQYTHYTRSKDCPVGH